jgi:pyridoxine 5'-phosphate synthase PdxJ
LHSIIIIIIIIIGNSNSSSTTIYVRTSARHGRERDVKVYRKVVAARKVNRHLQVPTAAAAESVCLCMRQHK